MAPYIGELILVGFNFAPAGYALCDGQLLPVTGNETLFTLIGTTYGGDGENTFALPDLRGRVPIGQGTSGVGSSYTLGETGGAELVTVVATQIPVHTHAIDLGPLTATAKCRNSAGNQITPVANVPGIEGPVPFTDQPLSVGSTLVRAAHVTELRTRIDAMRTHYSLGAFAYTTPALTVGTTVILAQHIQDLRNALAPVYTAATLSPPSYTDPNLANGTAIKAVHVTELRNAVLVVSGGGVAMPYSSAVPDANMNGAAIVVAGAVTAAPIGGSQSHENRQPFLALNYCIALQGMFPTPS